MSLTIIIVCRGRDNALDLDNPGALVPLVGKSMLYYAMETARALESATIIAAGPDDEQLYQAVDTDVAYVSRPRQLFDVAGVGQADDVLIFEANLPLIRSITLQQLVHHHRNENAQVTLLNFESEDSVGGRCSVFCCRSDWLAARLAHMEPGMGDGTFLAELLDLAPPHEGGIATLSISDPLEVLAVEDQVNLARAEAAMRMRINEHWMRSGVRLIHPDVTYIEAEVQIGAGTIIWPNTLIQGQTRIGQRAIIGPGSIIRDSVIGDECKVELSAVEHAIMEDGSDVGPYGHLRKGAHLGPGAHMGNFGEVKNSYLGPGVKMGHFSYVGDTNIGAEANIGAGTVTCNYDGQNKHPTNIGRAAFIGSGTMLVAPVDIGEGAKTGAGSVVTHDVPDGSVAYGVPAKTRSTAGAEESEGE